MNKKLGVFKSFFEVFEKDGKIMFGYRNMMRFHVDQWAGGGDFEQRRNLTLKI